MVRECFFSSLYFYPLRTTLDSRHLPRSSSPPCEDQESGLPGWPSWQNYQGVRSLVWDKNRYTRCKLYFARNAGKNKLGTFLWWHQNTFQLCFRLGLLAIAKVWALPVKWSWTYLAFTTSPPSTGRALLTSRQGRRKSSGGKGLHKIRQELFIRALYLRWQKWHYQLL